MNNEAIYVRATLGRYESLTMGIILENLYKTEADVYNELEEISCTRGVSPDDYEKRIREHRRAFDRYYRVRTHEKCHWYTAISSSVTIARLVQSDDSCLLIRSALKDILTNANSDVLLPLGKWAEASDCPKKIRSSVLVFNLNKYINAAIDGRLMNQHLFGNNHMLSFYFPDLKSLGSYWETQVYRNGLIALMEGAGKAAEWIYCLREDSSRETEAWQDITSTSEIYQSALVCLRDVITRRSLLEYLQLLVVLIDFSLNPWIDDESWPYLWGNTKRGNTTVKGVNTLPSFRFQRLLELLKKNPNIDTSSKETIFSYLAEMTTEEYGWKSPYEVIHQLSRLLENKAKTLSTVELWNPLETTRKVFQVKKFDPLAYIPPVNADLINRSETYPPIFLVCGTDHAAEEEKLLTYIQRSTLLSVTNDVVNLGLLRCPIANNKWMRIAWNLEEWCPYGKTCPALAARTPRDWIEDPQCDFYKGVLKSIPCDPHRIRFLTR